MVIIWGGTIPLPLPETEQRNWQRERERCKLKYTMEGRLMGTGKTNRAFKQKNTKTGSGQ